MADGSSKTVIYNKAGFRETSIDEDGVERGYEYDSEFGRLYRIYDAQDNYMEFVYDDQGNLEQKTKHDPTGQRFSYKRWRYDGPDIPGKLWQQINFNDSYTQYRYDDNGNLKSKTDPENRTTAYAYDAFNRLKTVTQTFQTPGDTTTSFRYDIQGNLVSVTDAEGHTTRYTYDGMGRLVIAASPDTGITGYAYDEAGNLIQKTDANSITTKYFFDQLNRLTAIRFPNSTEDITYSYDEGDNGIGHLTGMVDPSGSTTFGYDKRGRLVKKISFIKGYEYELTRQLSAGNRLELITYPFSKHTQGGSMLGTRETRYFRDANSGKIKKITTNRNSHKYTLFSDIIYDPFGRPSKMVTKYGGNVSNTSGGCGCIIRSNANYPMHQEFTYYDDRNLESITSTGNPFFNQYFTYDPLGRLENVNNHFKELIYSYDYDRVGNRLNRSIDGQTQTYTYYPNTNRLESVTGETTSHFAYDNNGNTTQIDNTGFGYTQNNRLANVSVNNSIFAEYIYNGLGQRVIKKIGDNTTIFLYDFNGKLIGESDPDRFIKTEYIYFLGTPVGTPVLMSKKTGGLVWEAEYKPFGEAEVGEEWDVVNNFRFPGQYFDEETGLHYNWHRYYDPKTGRYLTPDPIGLVGGINLYAYAQNNPVNLIDPYGLVAGEEALVLAALAGEAAGVAVLSGAIVAGTGAGTYYLTSIAIEDTWFEKGFGYWLYDFTHRKPDPYDIEKSKRKYRESRQPIDLKYGGQCEEEPPPEDECERLSKFIESKEFRKLHWIKQFITIQMYTWGCI
jgi:RHS repeat-associated protein